MRNISYYLSISIGVFYVFFIFWNRLLRERFPRDIFGEFNTNLILAYILLLLLSIFMIVYFLREIFEIKPKYKILNNLLKISVFNRIFIFISEIIIKSPKNLYEFLYNRIKIRPLVEYICDKIYIFDINEKPIILYFLLYYKYSFSLLIVIIFVIELFYFSRFQLFYFCLPFLLLPLITDFIISVIYDLAKKNTKSIEEWIVVTLNPDETWNIKLNRENKNNGLLQITDSNLLTENLKRHGENWLRYVYTNMTIDNYYKIENQYKIFINLFIYSLYSIGWGWILIKFLIIL